MGKPTEQLCDVERDPLGFVDLADRPNYSAVKAELAGRRNECMRQTDDRFRFEG